MTARARWAAGSRGIAYLIRHPDQILSGPSSDRAEQDVRAWCDGVPVRVACFLRGNGAPFPGRVRQGHLLLEGGTITWFPFWNVVRSGIGICGPAVIIGVRPPGSAEWNVKRPGRAFGIIPMPEWQTILIDANGPSLELTVTAIDKPLIEAALVGHGAG